MTRLGVDYSGGLPGGAAIRAAGYTFAMRYLGYRGSGRVDLTVDEIADLHANGVAIAAIWESTANRALSGYSGGQEDADIAKVALAALGWPVDRPVYFAVDFEASGGQLAIIDQYLRGAASVLGAGRIGVYGSYTVVSHCAPAGSAAWYWQCLAWSDGKMFEGRHVYQARPFLSVNGVGIDEDEANAADFGQWEPPAVITGGFGTGIQIKEDDMTEDQIRAIVADETAKQVTALFNAGAPPHFRHYVDLAINPQPGGFSDENGTLLPAVEDAVLVSRVEGIDARLAALAAQWHDAPSGVGPHTHVPGGVQ